MLFIILDSRPDGKQLDKLPKVEDIYDTTYLQREEFTLQREEFTIQREALSDFREIGKGLCMCVLCICVCLPVCVGGCVSVSMGGYVCM